MKKTLYFITFIIILINNYAGTMVPINILNNSSDDIIINFTNTSPTTITLNNSSYDFFTFINPFQKATIMNKAKEIKYIIYDTFKTTGGFDGKYKSIYLGFDDKNNYTCYLISNIQTSQVQLAWIITKNSADQYSLVISDFGLPQKNATNIILNSSTDIGLLNTCNNAKLQD